MNDSIYLVDPKTQRPVQVHSVSFADIAVKERADLEQWVVNHPEILGEPLLIISPEFAKFDRSSRRLDLLALDKAGVLVVVELKLDVAGSLADQQAIRYAAFCSTMTMEQAVTYFAGYHDVSEEEATSRICEFLEVEELPELDQQPRIILAAGSIVDQELTACVLWLRQFGINISCVELTPYRMPGSASVILVPRVIIPLPETRDFMIKTEQKELARVRQQQNRTGFDQLWRMVGAKFNQLGLSLKTAGRAKQNYMQVPVGIPHVHYEWLVRKRDKAIHVAIHFEDDDLSVNKRKLKPFEARKPELSKLLGQPLFIGPFGRRWTQVRISMPYTGAEPLPDVAEGAANLMKKMIDCTSPLLLYDRA